jgi:hypothetical protein
MGAQPVATCAVARSRYGVRGSIVAGFGLPQFRLPGNLAFYELA